MTDTSQGQRPVGRVPGDPAVRVLVRAARPTFRTQATIVGLGAACVLFVVAALPGYFEPTLTWRGYANYELTKYGRLPFMAMFLGMAIWAAYQLLQCVGRIGVLYGGDGRDGPWVGSWVSARLTPWRRMKLRPSVRISVRHWPRVSSGRPFDRTYIHIAGSGRRATVQVLSTLDKDGLSTLAAWLDARGLPRTLGRSKAEGAGQT